MNTLFSACGAGSWGAVPWCVVPFCGWEADFQPTGVFVATFPYYGGEMAGNISCYARGLDYHQVVVGRLQQVCDTLKKQYPGCHFAPSADNSPLPEVWLGAAAGLGVVGDSGLLLTKNYGSYVFLGTIVTDLEWDFPQPKEMEYCHHCGACQKACPGGALGTEGFEEHRCLSHLTQKKGELTAEETDFIRRHPYVWGCDTCQQVCPYNRGVKETTLPEFRQDLQCWLTLEELEGLTQRTFREQYGHRAFAWRGVNVLRRNIQVKK